MSKLIFVVMLIAILLAGYDALKSISGEITYAALWDAGMPPDTFAQWSGLESMNTPWIKECRTMWMAQKYPYQD